MQYILLLLLTTATTTDVYGQTGSIATLQNISMTYAVSIVPGAAQMICLLYYYPAIAVPVEWTGGGGAQGIAAAVPDRTRTLRAAALRAAMSV